MARDSLLQTSLVPSGYQKYLGVPRHFKFLWFWSSQHRKQPLTPASSGGGRRLHTIFVKEKKSFDAVLYQQIRETLYLTAQCTVCYVGVVKGKLLLLVKV